jgi:hypothetical protein
MFFFFFFTDGGSDPPTREESPSSDRQTPDSETEEDDPSSDDALREHSAPDEQHPLAATPSVDGNQATSPMHWTSGTENRYGEGNTYQV